MVGYCLSLSRYLNTQDDNRYNNSRGAHINLKRAEKARILIAKLPGALKCHVIYYESTFLLYDFAVIM
mgnify:CR=1 FL=1